MKGFNFIIYPRKTLGTVLDLLMKAIDEGHKLSNELQQFLCSSIFRNIVEFHQTTGIAHNDLKPDNIVLAELDNGHIGTMLIDLGSAHSLSSQVAEWCTTMNYVPPEVYPFFAKYRGRLPKRPFGPR